MDVKDKVLETLKNSGEPMKAGEIAETANIDKKEVDKALKALKSEEKISSPKRCYYSAN
ncbi:MarR family transcriptional regulator [Clostridium polynesiense]|uniref:MarR family transcriptional regulator n=1 Tax=Clostridium polynesiense TaxID=1325933 RepID=UPI000590EF99|nr:MarR family transcriptional regulator [Clostridium polynesiense]